MIQRKDGSISISNGNETNEHYGTYYNAKENTILAGKWKGDKLVTGMVIKADTREFLSEVVNGVQTQRLTNLRVFTNKRAEEEYDLAIK
jgi:hypothetical protein